MLFVLEKKSGDLSGNGRKDIKTISTNASNWLQGEVASHLKVTRLSPVCCWGDSLGAFWLPDEPILNHASWLTLLLSLSGPLIPHISSVGAKCEPVSGRREAFKIKSLIFLFPVINFKVLKTPPWKYIFWVGKMHLMDYKYTCSIFVYINFTDRRIDIFTQQWLFPSSPLQGNPKTFNLYSLFFTWIDLPISSKCQMQIYYNFKLAL